VIIKIQGNVSLVSEGARVCRCELRGRIKKGAEGESTPLAVGDRVLFREIDQETGVIEERLPRRSRFLRQATMASRDAEARMAQVLAANVDQLVVVAATREPAYKKRLIDRILVSAEKGGLEALLCVNKIDLADRAVVERDLAVYGRIGYGLIFTSALSGLGLDELKGRLVDRTSVFAGPSGAGKSSLLNAIQPGLKLRTGSVSRATGKGRHITTGVSLLRLSFGGYVADTPGIRGFGLWAVSRDELRDLYPEFRRPAELCRFRNCAHREEPDCAVKAALERGEIDRDRYESYMRIYESL
jgi:ribosome biogenesis GTPase